MEQQHEKIDIQESIQNLNKIVGSLLNKSFMIDPYLKDYITIYVQYHTLSEQFFTNFCEHKILSLLTQFQNRINSHVCILESLNLLLVNTKQSNQLIYILSQPSLHQYLFTNSPDQNSQFIEYFSQLLKTILLKISQSQQSSNLIKLFYNTKFPHFPIFTHATILSCHKNQLVKVTSQQCVLIVINLLNRNLIPANFLVGLPMMAMIVKMIINYSVQGSDQTGIINYLVDLFYELRRYRPVLLLINNLIFNYIGIRNIPERYQIPLDFFHALGFAVCSKISQVKTEQKNFNRQETDNLLIIVAAHLRALIKYLTNKYLSGCYLMNYQKLSKKNLDLNSLKYASQYKFYTAKCAQFVEKKQLDRNLSYFNLSANTLIDDISNRIFQYQKGPELKAQKQSYLKNSGYSVAKIGNSVYGYLSKKVSWGQQVQQWGDNLEELVGLHTAIKKPILHNISNYIYPSKSVFIGQFCKIAEKIWQKDNFGFLYGQQPDIVCQLQTNFNTIRSNWGFKLSALKTIYQMSRQFVSFIEEESRQQLVLPNISMCYSHLFLMQLKEYLECFLDQKFMNEQFNKQFMSQPDCVIHIVKICRNLNVQLKDHCRSNFAFKLNSLHGQVQGKLFQNCFIAANKYFGTRDIIFKKSYIETKIFYKHHIEEQIIIILVYLQCIQKIMNPKEKLLLKFYEPKWKQKFIRQFAQKQLDIHQQGLRIKVYQILFQENEAKVAFINGKQECKTYIVIFNLEQLEIFRLDICLVDKIQIYNLEDKNIGICFKQNQIKCFTTKSLKEKQDFISNFTNLKLYISEAITAATIEYLEFIHKQLCQPVFKKTNKTSALDMLTPGA